ncbi:MAG: glycosyltransferase [Bacteroidia bacterium]|nr:glycosyltransferase [Bacteroidia bacterium]
MAPVAAGIALVVWIGSGNWKAKAGNMKANAGLILFPLYFLLHLAGMAWTENASAGWADVETKLSLFILPVLFAAQGTVPAELLRSVKRAFVCGLILSVFIGLTFSSWNYFYEWWQVRTGELSGQFYNTDFFLAGRFSPFVHPGYYAVYLSFGMFLIMEEVLFNFRCSAREKRGAGFIIILFGVAVLLTVSRIGMFCIFLLAIRLLYLLAFKKGKPLSALAVILIVGITGMLVYFNSATIRYRVEQTITGFSSNNTKDSTDLRSGVWHSAWEAGKEDRLKGSGTGDVKQLLIKKYRENGLITAADKELNAHNQFLQSTAALGLPGLILLALTFIITFLKPNFQLRVLLMVLFAFMLVESVLEIQAGTLFVAFWIPLMCISGNSGRNAKRSLLIVTQYFPPETGAPQNRLYELALRLRKSGMEVNVLTALPNYPRMEIMKGYRNGENRKENMEGMIVYRCWIYVSKKRSIFPRLLNYFSFVWTSMWAGLFRIPRHDIILIESPPLFLGISGRWIAFWRGSNMIFNVSDLWPESAEKLGLVKNRLFLRAATVLEEQLYRKSWKITGQTQGIVKNISERFPGKKIHWLPNGVDLRLYTPEPGQGEWRKKAGIPAEKLLITYAGIIGHAQGLEVILRAAHRLQDLEKVQFLLLGDGPEKEGLMTMARQRFLSNVLFLDPVSKKEMREVVRATDLAVVPLRRLELFKGAIPSKIFENIAMKKPVLLGVDGEARSLFIEEGKCGYYFEPENDEDLAKAVRHAASNPEELETMGENGRVYAEKRFNREIIAAEFMRFIEND